MEMTTAQIEALVSEVMSKMAQRSDASPAQASPVYADQAALGAGGNEPFDLDYGMMDTSGATYGTPYPRIEKIMRRVLAEAKYVDAERALLVTKAYQMYEGDPPVIKQAKVLAYILSNISLHIHPDELIVGEVGAPSRATPIFPEFSYEWIIEELEAGVWNKRNNDVFEITEEDKQALLSIRDYWKGRTNSDQIIDMLSDEESKGSSLGPKPVFFPNLHLWGGVGHIIPRYQKLLKVGYIGLKNEIMEQFAKLGPNAEDLKRREFYIAQLIVLDAVKSYYLRWAALARDEAAKCGDAKRRAELLKIADNVEWCSENPPRDFYEAIQFYYMLSAIILIESNGQGVSWGRMDQVLHPFYEADMKAGKITKQFVGELVEQLYVKIFEEMRLRDDETSRLNSELGIGGPLLIVGGVDKDGNDATNDLTYIALEAHAHTQLPDPWFSARWSMNAPWEYKVKVVNTIKVGTSQPKLFNDECIIPNCMRAGRTLAEARDYAVVGCVEIDSGGLEYGEHDAAYFNMGKVLELTLNNGRCIDCCPSCPRYGKCGPNSGRSLGPDTGSLATYKSFDEVKEAFTVQMEYWVKQMCSSIIVMDIAHARNKPIPYASLLIENCIEKGKDLTEGGAKYNFSGPQGIGVGTVADGLAAIRQLIFEEGKTTGAELLDALKKNWEGHEPLYALVNSEHVHHFGNDDDYADELARFSADTYCNAVDRYKNYRGGIFHPGMYSVSANVGIGMTQAASPDGRKNYEALSNCMGPVQTAAGCHDFRGPTAMARSAAKVDHIRAGNGTLLNVRFTPACVSGDTGRDNFINYIDEYFSRKGLHVQFNIVNTETLLDAQAHPEKYPNLLVRVAGYSAYFTKLSKELQDDLIGRNSYDSFD